MEYVLRPKQIEAVDLAVDFLTDGRQRNGLLVEPTAFGKSLVIAEIAHRLGGGLLVFQPTLEILQQNEAKLIDYGYSPAVWSASAKRNELGDIVLATIGSVKNYASLFEEYPYVLVDEVHLLNSREGMYKRFLSQMDNVKLLGLSATPWRLHSSSMGTQAKFLTRTRPRLIHEVVHYTQIADMVESGHWAKLEYYPVAGFKSSKLPLNSTGADFDEKAAQLHLWEKNWTTKDNTAVHFPDKLTEIVQRLLAAGRKHILVFTSWVRESQYLAEQMKGECAMVSGETPASEREWILSNFRSGDIPVVTNAAVLINGFDFPQIDAIVDAAPTRSLARFMQKYGRGVRVHPDKENCWIVDMVEGLKTFGRLEDLKLYCDGESKWGIFGRPGGGKEVALTNVWIGGNPGCCPKCLAPKQVAYYTAKEKWLPISVAPAGMRANLVVEQVNGKKSCRLVERGDPEATAVFHFLACDRLRKMREQ